MYQALRNLLKLILVRRPKQARPRPIPQAIPLPTPPRSQLLQLLLLKVVITIIACVKLFNPRRSSSHSAIPTQLLLKHQQLVTPHTFLCATISRQAFLQYALALTRLRLQLSRPLLSSPRLRQSSRRSQLHIRPRSSLKLPAKLILRRMRELRRPNLLLTTAATSQQ